MWAAFCSYVTQVTPAGLRSTAQGVIQGLHLGLGRGCGAVLGGILVTAYGMTMGRGTLVTAYGMTIRIRRGIHVTTYAQSRERPQCAVIRPQK